MTGEYDQGLAALNEAINHTETTRQRWLDSEIHRLKGQLLLSRSASTQTDAEGCFTRALEVARRQEARSFELRAATSLADLWRGQNKVAEARVVLAPVYDWFTEGFDTRDLEDAKALLEELA